MRNYLDTLLNLHPTPAEQDAVWETTEDANKHALVDFIGFLIVAAFAFLFCF